MIKNYEKYSQETKFRNDVVMVIKAETVCSKCGHHETIYIDEQAVGSVEHICCKCKNDRFNIRYKY